MHKIFCPNREIFDEVGSTLASKNVSVSAANRAQWMYVVGSLREKDIQAIENAGGSIDQEIT